MGHYFLEMYTSFAWLTNYNQSTPLVNGKRETVIETYWVVKRPTLQINTIAVDCIFYSTSDNNLIPTFDRVIYITKP